MRRKVRRRVGDLLKVDLGDGSHTYAQVGPEPLIIFFDGLHRCAQIPTSVEGEKVLFRIWVMNYAVTSGRWLVIGTAPLLAENAAEPRFFKQDTISGQLSIYHSAFATTNYERPASIAECQDLERAAVWEPEHVEGRLRDHFAGRANQWFESLKIKPQVVSRT